MQSILQTVITLLENRLDLFAIELREEQERFVRLAVLALLGVLLALLGLGVATAAIILFVEPANRFFTCCVMSFFYLFLAVLIWLSVLKRIRETKSFFVATRSELKKDILCLR